MERSKSTYRYISIILACLVFCSSAGLILGKHHCNLKEKNLLEGTQYSCAETGCKKGCCSTEFQYFKLDQDQQTNLLGFKLTKQPTQLVFQYVALFHENGLKPTDTPLFERYKPPLIPRDIPVLTQSFLL